MSHQVDASASILTRMRLTLVDFDLAVLSGVAWHALQQIRKILTLIIT